MDLIELPLGRFVLRLDGTIIEVIDRTESTPLRIHVNHAGARLEPTRQGLLKLSIGWPKRWIYGTGQPGPGEDLLWDDLQVDARGQVQAPPAAEPQIRALLVEAARRRTAPLPDAVLV